MAVLPEQIGGFRVLRVLGKGGMGAVYLAQREDGGHVAIKVVHEPTAHMLNGLRHEIRALLQVKHPSVVGVVAHGVNDLTPWVALDYIEGVELRSVLDAFRSELAILPQASDLSTSFELASTLAPGELIMRKDGSILLGDGQSAPIPESLKKQLGYIAQVLRGLSYLHQAGVVHRDLKPENIVIRASDDCPVLVDFGIAIRGGGEREALTVQSGVSGTPPYMSPEQIGGDWADARSDLYSIGCILYEILTGQPPFNEANPAATMFAHIGKKPEPLPASVPKGLRDLVDNLLSKSPSDRIGYADDVAKLLEQFIGTPDSPVNRSTRLFRPDFVAQKDLVDASVKIASSLTTHPGGLKLITGRPGAGKTRFSLELVAELQKLKSVACVSFNVDSTTTGASRFASVMVRIIDRCREAGPEFTQRVLGNEGGVLCKLNPAVLLLPGMEHVQPIPDLPFQSELMRRVNAWLQVQLRMHGKPVVVVLDETDAELVRLLKLYEGMQRASALPVWIFGTVDEHEAAQHGFGDGQLLPLAPYQPAHIRQIVQSALGQHDLPESLYKWVENNSSSTPASVTAVLRLAVEKGTLQRHALTDAESGWFLDEKAVSGSFPVVNRAEAFAQERIRRVPVHAQELLASLSLTHSLPVHVVLDMDDSRSLDALLNEELVGFTEAGHVACDRESVRNVIWVVIDEKKRADLARKLAFTFMKHNLDALAAGELFVTANDVDSARDAFYQAAKTAASHGQSALEAECQQRFLDTEPPDDDRKLDAMVELMKHVRRKATPARQMEVCEAGAALARELGRTYPLVIFLNYIALGIHGSDPLRAHQILDEGEALAHAANHPLALAGVHNARGSIHIRRGAEGLALTAFRRCMEVLPEDAPPMIKAAFAVNSASVLRTAGHVKETIEWLDYAHRVAKEHRLDEIGGYILGNHGMLLLEQTFQFEEALRLLVDAKKLHEDCFDARPAAFGQLGIAMALNRMKNRPKEALVAAMEAEALHLKAKTGLPFLNQCRAMLGTALAGVGRVDQARETFESARGDEIPDSLKIVLVMAACEFERQQRQFDAARAWLQVLNEGYSELSERHKVDLAIESARIDLAERGKTTWPPSGLTPNPGWPRVIELERELLA